MKAERARISVAFTCFCCCLFVREIVAFSGACGGGLPVTEARLYDSIIFTDRDWKLP